MDVIVGTAGHIDHGKTALIKALTGVDADRLPEEKRRGITVDLGFAEASVGDVHFGFVDVPGHERFVKNMLAGASGIDIVMLIIAADEGVMPQTREHFDICRLLGVKAGIIVLTKTDLVDAEMLELAKLDAAELVTGSFLENAPLLSVSSRTGDGVDLIRASLVEIGLSLPNRSDQFVTRLPIDRSFSVKGFGAVVTGTLGSGKITEGEDIEMLPSKTKVRVRGLQTHGQSVKTARAGQRVAVNLGGIDHSKVARGMLLSEPGILHPSHIFDAEVEVLANAARSLRSRQRIRLHIGTVEALARVQVLNDAGEIATGEKDLIQIRLETPVTAVPNERFIVRSYSPQVTIGGGKVIDTFASRHRRRDIQPVREFLTSLLAADSDGDKVNILVRAAGTSGLSLAEIRSKTAMSLGFVSTAINDLLSSGDIVDADGRYIERTAFESLLESVETNVVKFHEKEPVAKGISLGVLREQLFAYLPAEIFQAAMTKLESGGKLAIDKDIVRLIGYKTTLSTDESSLCAKILTIYNHAHLEVPKLDEALDSAIVGTRFTTQEARKFFQLFLDSGEIVKVNVEFYFAKTAIERLIVALLQFAESSADRTVDVTRFKELAGVSRKYAIPLLEYFDSERVTRRVGDKRVIL